MCAGIVGAHRDLIGNNRIECPTLTDNSVLNKIVNSEVEIYIGPAYQGLSIEPSTSLLTALLETTELFKTLEIWVRNLDLVGALRLK